MPDSVLRLIIRTNSVECYMFWLKTFWLWYISFSRFRTHSVGTLQYIICFPLLHLAPFDVKLGSIWLSRILKCEKENDYGRLIATKTPNNIKQTYLDFSQVSMK